MKTRPAFPINTDAAHRFAHEATSHIQGDDPERADAYNDAMSVAQRGMTTRQYAAIHLFGAMITTSGAPALLGLQPGEDQFARAAIRLADTLLAEEAKTAPR